MFVFKIPELPYEFAELPVLTFVKGIGVVVPVR
jgi:hypothetical protein